LYFIEGQISEISRFVSLFTAFSHQLTAYSLHFKLKKFVIQLKPFTVVTFRKKLYGEKLNSKKFGG